MTRLLLLMLTLISAQLHAADDLRLFAFDCGRLRFEDVSAFGLTNEETSVREMVVPCYVIDHPKGRLLWDGGLPSAVASIEGWQMGEGFTMRLDQTLAEQLQPLEIGIESFDFVAFSHMHFDHVGVANEVTNATLLIQTAEYEAAFKEPVFAMFDPELYKGLVTLKHKLLDGEHDVFGDGRVRIYAAPGHTPGHQVLYINLANTGGVVLSGDLYHFAFSRENRRVPDFNHDKARTLESMAFVENLLMELDADLWVEHDLAQFLERRTAPEFSD